MRLSKRIYKISEMIAPGETVADIGTDHGYVPMILIRDGVSPHAIMSDISEGSLAKAKKTFKACKLPAEDDDFRVGDGLRTLSRGEVDAVIIAGLGGHTIVDILSADEDKSKSFAKLVLQPRKHSGSLRYYLYTHGWDISEDTLASEGKFECEIIVATPSDADKRTAPYREDDIRWVYPAEAAMSEPKLALKRINWKLKSINEQIANLKRSRKVQSDELIEKLQGDADYLTEICERIKGV